jgi:cobalt/nickel transport system ATP-binding protein
MVLIASDVCYRYPSSGFGVQDISLSVSTGEGVGLLGPNGAGKSTLLLLLSGLIKPDSGVVSVFSSDTRSRGFKEIRKRIGVVFQDPDDMLFNSTVYDEVAYAAVNSGLTDEEVEEAVKRALSSVDASGLMDREPSRLSFGEKRRVALASALVLEPDLLLMDEPTANLDNSARRELISLVSRLRRRGVTIIISSHDVEALPGMVDRAVLLRDGHIVADGLLRSILTDEELLAGLRLEPPQITQLFLRLREQKIDLDLPLTIEEAEKEIIKVSKRV